VAEGVDVGDVGVDVLAQRVRVLEQLAERLRFVRRGDRAGDCEDTLGVIDAGDDVRVGDALGTDQVRLPPRGLLP